MLQEGSRGDNQEFAFGAVCTCRTQALVSASKGPVLVWGLGSLGIWVKGLGG